MSLIRKRRRAQPWPSLVFRFGLHWSSRLATRAKFRKPLYRAVTRFYSDHHGIQRWRTPRWHDLMTKEPPHA